MSASARVMVTSPSKAGSATMRRKSHPSTNPFQTGWWTSSPKGMPSPAAACTPVTLRPYTLSGASSRSAFRKADRSRRAE